MLFADKLINAVPIVDDILNVSGHNADQSDGAEERYQSRSYLPMVTVNKDVVNSVLRHFGLTDNHRFQSKEFYVLNAGEFVFLS